MAMKIIADPKTKTFQIESKLFLYHKPVIMEPHNIPISKAMNMVPDPSPRFCFGDKSAVQAKIVGEVMPVAIPKTVAEIKNHVAFFEIPIISMEMIKINNPTKSVSLRPYLSDKFPVNNRMNMVDETYMTKNAPLFEMDKNEEISGARTKTIPELIVDNNMTIATGKTAGSIIS